MIRIILFTALLAFFITAQQPLQANASQPSWSSWRTLTTVDGVKLEYRYKHRAERTDVQWQATNYNNERVYVSIIEKEYFFAGGKKGTHSSVGSNVNANDSYRFMPDTLRGDVRAVSARLVVTRN